jgi:glutaredoxin
MEQRCHLAAVWLTWLGLPLLAVVVGVRIGWAAAGAVLLTGILGQVLYVRWFPHISRWLGYGSVSDIAAGPAREAEPRLPRVKLYTANVCPFCPIVKRRLADLRRQMGFEVDEIDVTFRPDLVRAKGLRSVPVVEAGGRLLVGNATSAQLADFLRGAASPEQPVIDKTPPGR